MCSVVSVGTVVSAVSVVERDSMGLASAGRLGHLMCTSHLSADSGFERIRERRWAILAATGKPEVHAMTGPVTPTPPEPVPLSFRSGGNAGVRDP